jgi:drug/metabolite transporter (DMT)-like permease
MPYFALLISLVVLSQSALLVRLANIPSSSIGFWRMVIVLPVIFTLLVYRQQLGALFRLRKSQVAQLFLAGFFLFAHFYTWFLSVQLTSVANAMILFCTNPIFTMLLAWYFFSERITARMCFTLLLAVLGVVILVGDGSSASAFTGDILGLICGLFFSGYMLASKSVRKDLPNLPFAFFTYLVCGALFFLVAKIGGDPLWGYGSNTWLSLAGLAFGSTLLGHSLLTFCLQYFPVGFISVATLTEPVIAAATGYWLLGESLTGFDILGMLLVIVAIGNLFWPELLRRVPSRGKKS